ncbi:hypothetical protein RHMOL_Rhmol10G0049800 [Rhododendron molle]|uniref:Uncharacterized protein n=1 Tax=Rhododendron molle TaxID=49168 RepID=A0ACC0LZ65_RHOML|nr:hypothetical protein RHMOL_Rhmol10G0049800 [Rhododendron molle]
MLESLYLNDDQLCIGATTLDEYRKHIEKDPALERRFQPVKVPEPTVDETIEILKGLRERYEMHHKLSYTDEALVSAAKLSYQYISDRFLPDKAIDLLDEAGSCVRLRHAQLPKELDKELRQTTKRLEFADTRWEIWVSSKAEPRLESKKHRRQSRKTVNQSIIEELDDLDDDDNLLDDSILTALRHESQ